MPSPRSSWGGLKTRLQCLRDAPLRSDATPRRRRSGLIVVRRAAEASTLRTGCATSRQFDRAFGPGPFRVPKMWSC